MTHKLTLPYSYMTHFASVLRVHVLHIITSSTPQRHFKRAVHLSGCVSVQTRQFMSKRAHIQPSKPHQICPAQKHNTRTLTHWAHVIKTETEIHMLDVVTAKCCCRRHRRSHKPPRWWGLYVDRTRVQPDLGSIREKRIVHSTLQHSCTAKPPRARPGMIASEIKTKRMCMSSRKAPLMRVCARVGVPICVCVYI